MKRCKIGRWLLSILTIIGMCIQTTPFYAQHNLESRVDNQDHITGAQIDEKNIKVIYYVDKQNPAASDKNPGTEDMPLETIARAAVLAMEDNKNGEGVKIIIKPGIYREIIPMAKNGEETEAPIIFEGARDEKVVIRGSIILGGQWEKEGKYYTHDWLMKWGPGDDIWVEDYNIHLQEIVRHREMIFVNGELLNQVLSKEALIPGAFYVDENEKKAYLYPSSGIDMDVSDTEVSINEGIFKIEGKENIILRGLIMQQSNPYYYGPAAVQITRSQNILIESCEVSWNNGFGIGLHSNSDITIKGVSSNHNGSGGIVGSENKNILITDSETSYNNWRGAQGSFYDWSTAGIKLLFAHDVKVVKHESNYNSAPGIWFDSENQNIYIEDSQAIGNNGPGKNIIAGVYLEGSIGPLKVNRCTLTDNKRGINIASSNNVSIINSVIGNNLESQIYVFSDWGKGRTFESWETGEAITSLPIDTRIEDCIISAPSDSTSTLFAYDWEDPVGYTLWIESLKTKEIYYYHPNFDEAFLLKDAKRKGGLEVWQDDTGLDSDAKWVPAPPKDLEVKGRNEHSIVLNWSPSPSAAKGYKIYRNNSEIGKTTELNYVDENLLPGEEYRYTIKAYSDESSESLESNAVNFFLEKSAVNLKGSSAGASMTLLVIVLIISILSGGLWYFCGNGFRSMRTIEKKDQ